MVLQEQSQLPSFPQGQVEAEVFPFAARLVDSVYVHNPCAEPVFYMTWGRRDGDAMNAAEFPVLGTYEGMDSMLCERYLQMATDNDASVCPVGRVWRHLRERRPELELYQTDGSHPSTAGTYAAACAFYVMFFGDSPLAITYTPSGLDIGSAETIRNAVHDVVYTRIESWRRPEPTAQIELTDIDGYEVSLTAHLSHAEAASWSLGDGVTAEYTDSTLSHTYSESGDYEVTLVASRHCMTDTVRLLVHLTGDTTTVGIAVCESEKLIIFPNPSVGKPTIVFCPHGDENPDWGDPASIIVTTPDGRNIPYDILKESDMVRGIYLIRAIRNGVEHRGKFVIVSQL